MSTINKEVYAGSYSNKTITFFNLIVFLFWTLRSTIHPPETTWLQTGCSVPKWSQKIVALLGATVHPKKSPVRGYDQLISLRSEPQKYGFRNKKKLFVYYCEKCAMVTIFEFTKIVGSKFYPMFQGSILSAWVQESLIKRRLPSQF